MKKIKVLQITSKPYINSGVMGVLMNYNRKIIKYDIQFDYLFFMTCSKEYSTYEREIEKLGGRYYYILNLYKYKEFNRKLNELLNNNKYDIVQIHDPFITPFIYKTIKRNNIKKIITYSHATKWSDKKISAIRNRVLCINLTKKANLLFACSKEAGEFLYGKKSKFTTINNAIDLEKYSFNKAQRSIIRKQLDIEKNIVFGHVGNFNKQKNHRFLIYIFKEILAIDPSAKLLLIGDGPLREKVEIQINNLKLNESIIYLGKQTDLAKYYSAMDCFILPSIYEGLPMVGVESQCNGLPILLSDSISKDAGIYKYKYMSLNDEPKQWAKEAIKMSKVTIAERIHAQEVLRDKGFSINEEAEKLANIYKAIAAEKI